MATTAVSSTTQTKSTDIVAANKTAAQKLITALNAGSGVDVASLAQNLVDAERVPQENAINDKISKNEKRISGYAAISFVASELNNAFTALKDQNSFTSVSASISQPSAFGITAGPGAATGTHDIEVLQLAKAQRNASVGYALPTTNLNGGKGMTLNFTVAGAAKRAINLNDGKDTPQDIVSAINAAKIGVTATLVNTGDGSGSPYQIVLTGAQGAANTFSFTTSYTQADGSSDTIPVSGSPGLTLNPNSSANQTAADARIKLDGITLSRSNNVLTDVVGGLTIDLKGLTSGPATVNLERDTSTLKSKFNALVSTYNDAMTMLGVVTDPKSTMETYGATLVGDSTARSVKAQIRSLVQFSSNTPGDSVSALWQLGISVDQDGKMSLDETKFDDTMANHFDDAVKALTGNTNGLSTYSNQPAGIFGNAIRKLGKLIGPSGPLLTNTQNAETQNTDYQSQLSKLDLRMQSLLSRYTKQFSVMESLVGSVNSQKTSLKSTFEGMMAMYTNK